MQSYAVRLEKLLTGRARSGSATGGTLSAAYYLRFVRDLLDSVENGVSRDQFLKQVFEYLDVSGSVKRSLLVLEGYPSGEGVEGLSAQLIASDSPHRHDEFRRALPSLRRSPFIYALMVSGYSLEFESSAALSQYGGDLVPYDDEFGTLMSGQYWICSMPLVANARGDAARCLICLYPVENLLHQPTVPPGAEQEWRLLRLVSALYQVLHARHGDLLSYVDEDTQALLNALAPNAIRHELGTNLGLMAAAIASTPPSLRALHQAVGKDNPDLLALTSALVEIDRQIKAARRTADAFTNLERRNASTVVELTQLVQEIEVVLQQALRRAWVDVIIDIPAGLSLRTDMRLLSNILMNVMMNAVEAIELQKRAPSGARNRHKIAIVAKDRGSIAEIVVANDGPLIPPQIASRIFDRGVTSKPLGSGHGYGLFLCRQIATHLGGHIGFGKPPEKLPGARVSFMIELPKSQNDDSSSDEQGV